MTIGDKRGCERLGQIPELDLRDQQMIGSVLFALFV
jgi:hypothetical protein